MLQKECHKKENRNRRKNSLVPKRRRAYLLTEKGIYSDLFLHVILLKRSFLSVGAYLLVNQNERSFFILQSIDIY